MKEVKLVTASSIIKIMEQSFENDQQKCSSATFLICTKTKTVRVKLKKVALVRLSYGLMRFKYK